MSVLKRLAELEKTVLNNDCWYTAVYEDGRKEKVHGCHILPIAIKHEGKIIDVICPKGKESVKDLFFVMMRGCKDD